MRPVQVVVSTPALDHGPSLLARSEPLGTEALVAQLAVEALVCAETWAAFAFASNVAGHLGFQLRSWLEEFYDWSRRQALNAHIASVRCAVETVVTAPMRRIS